MCKEFLMKDRKSPKVTILNFFCPKMDDMNQYSCDSIMLLKYRKAPGIDCHGAFLVFGKVVLQDADL